MLQVNHRCVVRSWPENKPLNGTVIAKFVENGIEYMTVKIDGFSMTTVFRTTHVEEPKI